MWSLPIIAVTLLAFSPGSSTAPTLLGENPSSVAGPTIQPVFTSDFADPSLLEANNIYYAYATNHGGTHVQVATSQDFGTWVLHEDLDALPNLPPWVNKTHSNVWAPKVWQRKDGLFVMYYSATHVPLAISPGISRQTHCIGAAVSEGPQGPFSPAAGDALICQAAEGGVIDPSHFRDTDGQDYVVYKVDGNSIGHGGVCGNSVAPVVPTPIMLQKVSSDGLSLIGGPTQILDRDNGDGPLVEAPSIALRADGRYVLTYSSNCWNTAQYDVGYALAEGVEGPYVKTGVLLNTGVQGLRSPGGADLSSDASRMVFHANFGSVRAMFTATLEKGSAIL